MELFKTAVKNCCIPMELFLSRPPSHPPCAGGGFAFMCVGGVAHRQVMASIIRFPVKQDSIRLPGSE